MPFARLTRDFRHRPGLTRFLPARLSADGAEVTPVEWHGSGDIPALTRANAYLVADPGRAEYARGELDPGAAQMKKLSHFDSAGSPRMVDVSAKPATRRTARAHAFVRIAAECAAQAAGEPQRQSARNRAHRRASPPKRTSELIPLCHPLMLTHADVEVTVEKEGVRIVASAATTGQTGVDGKRRPCGLAGPLPDLGQYRQRNP